MSRTLGTRATRLTLWLVIACLLACPALAQTSSNYPAYPSDPDDPVMGICAAWSYLNASSYCTGAGPALDIGTTTNANPTFNIGMNDGSTANPVLLLVLIPQSSTTGLNGLTFSATFTQNGSSQTVNTINAFGAPSGSPFISNQDLLGYLGLVCNTTVTGNSCNDMGANYHFNSINGLQTVAGTLGYSVYDINAQFGTVGPANKTANGPQIIGVSFSNFSAGSGFPAGTIFLALGLNGTEVLYKTPLTLGEEVTPVPEPVSLSLFGMGLIAVGSYVRRRGKRS